MRLDDMARGGKLQKLILALGTAFALGHLPGCNGGRIQNRAGSGDGGAASAAKFTDITTEAGLNFIQYHGGCGQRYFVEQVAAGAAIFDANGDGFPDIYFPGPKPMGVCKFKEPLRQRLFLNDGTGHFKLSENAFGGDDTDYGLAAAVGDYDNDGHPDLFVACHGKCKLYHNKGDGTFEDVTAKSGINATGFCTGAVWFDYDGDGKLDLYVLRYCNWSLQNDIPCLGPNGQRDVCEPRFYTPSTNFLFHNEGNGKFTNVTAKSGASPSQRRSLGVAAADFDGDGKLDLFVANDLGPNYYLHNNGNGTFTDEAMQKAVAFGLTGGSQANMGVAVGDYNDSGRLSVCISTFSGEPYTLYRNDGSFFTDSSADAGIAQVTLPYLAFGAGFFDSRNLGRLDLFFANGHVSPFSHLKDGKLPQKQKNILMTNDGTGKFVDASDALPKDDVRVHRYAGFGDFNGDGKLDVLVTASDDRPTLLRNDSSQNNWVILKLTDKYRCATPYGTQCTATFAAKKLFRVLYGGGSYGGDSDPRLHIGLGTATKIDTLEIKWLSGKTQILKDVKANQVLSVKED